MPPETWKKIELKICKRFGGSRAGAVGSEGADCTGTYPFSVQVKHRDVPKWLTAAVEQARGDAEVDELPLVALHPKGTGIGKTLIIIELQDFETWYLK